MRGGARPRPVVQLALTRPGGSRPKRPGRLRKPPKELKMFIVQTAAAIELDYACCAAAASINFPGMGWESGVRTAWACSFWGAAPAALLELAAAVDRADATRRDLGAALLPYFDDPPPVDRAARAARAAWVTRR